MVHSSEQMVHECVMVITVTYFIISIMVDLWMVLTCNQYLWIGFNSVNIRFHILRKKLVISLRSTARSQEV